MGKESISQILARNLRDAIKAKKMSQPKLATASGVPQTTISLMLRPKARQSTAGKAPPSPTIERISMLAHALERETWQLLHPDPEQAQRETKMYKSIEADFAKITAKAPA